MFLILFDTFAHLRHNQGRCRHHSCVGKNAYHTWIPAYELLLLEAQRGKVGKYHPGLQVCKYASWQMRPHSIGWMAARVRRFLHCSAPSLSAGRHSTCLSTPLFVVEPLFDSVTLPQYPPLSAYARVVIPAKAGMT